jgi:hypothetical protein
MRNFRNQLAAAAIGLVVTATYAQTGFAAQVEECRAIDCSGQQISCPSGNPITKLLCEQRKATWKAQCEVEKRLCFATGN